MITARIAKARLVLAAVAIVAAVAGLPGGTATATSPPSWVTVAAPATARFGHDSVTLANGKVLVVGGENSSGFADTAEIYDPGANTWSPAGTPGFGSAPTATVLGDGKVLVASGSHQNGRCPAADCVDDRAAVFGPTTNTFSPVPAMTARRVGHTATLLAGGNVLVAGGDPNELLVNDSAEIYHPATNTWTPAAAMSHPRTGHTASRLPDGRVLVAGGESANGLVGTATAELYDPVTATWSPAASMASTTLAHTTTTTTITVAPLATTGSDMARTMLTGSLLVTVALLLLAPAAGQVLGRDRRWRILSIRSGP